MLLAVLAVGFALLVPAMASAATVTVGSPVLATSTGTLFASDATLANTALSEAGANVTSPVTGVVVRWRVSYADGGPDELRVLTPGSGGSYTGAGTSAPETPASTATQTYPTHLPIQAGQTIGLDLPAGSGIGVTLPSGSTLGFWQPPILDGSAESESGHQSGREATFNADVVPQPGVSMVSPASGPLSGGTQVAIQGHDFAGATAVSFDGRPATSFTVDSDNKIRAVAPASSALGRVDVTVITPGGTSPTSAADSFTYTANSAPPPTCFVPKLRGKALGKARKLLTAAHCSLGLASKPKHHKGNKLVVKAQSPSAGTVLPNGTSVSVKLGPKRHKKHH